MEGTAPPSLDTVKMDFRVWRAQLHLLWALLKETSGIQHHRPYCWGITQQQKGQSECQCAIMCAFSLFMLHIYSELSAPAQKLSRWPTVAGFSVCWFVWVCLFFTLSTVFHWFMGEFVTLQHLTVEQTQPQALAAIVSDSIFNVMKKPACVACTYCTVSQPFSALHWKRANQHGCSPRSSNSKQDRQIIDFLLFLDLTHKGVN